MGEALGQFHPLAHSARQLVGRLGLDTVEVDEVETLADAVGDLAGGHLGVAGVHGHGLSGGLVIAKERLVRNWMPRLSLAQSRAERLPLLTADPEIARYDVIRVGTDVKEQFEYDLALEPDRAQIRGRLVVFFPGHLERSNYRLLDARDGWNYMAVPITLHSEGALS